MIKKPSQSKIILLRLKCLWIIGVNEIFRMQRSNETLLRIQIFDIFKSLVFKLLVPLFLQFQEDFLVAVQL